MNSTSKEPVVSTEVPNMHAAAESMFRLALTKLGRSELKAIQVRVCRDVVQIRGCVSSFHAKQVAQEALRPLALGLRIDNQLRVVGRQIS